jgi:hypothetical protein
MKSNINKLAVLICGEFRTWEIGSKYIFEYAENQAVHVDYYFATWDTSNYPNLKEFQRKIKITDQDITEKFTNKKLIDYKIINSEIYQSFKFTFYHQAYLAKIANILKRKYELENDFIYDQVLELRPDLFIPKKLKNLLTLCKNFEYSISHSFYYIDENPGLLDWYYRSNSFSNDILADRYYFNDPIGDIYPLMNNNHNLLYNYVTARKLVSQPNILLNHNIPSEFNEFSGISVLTTDFPKNINSSFFW